MRAPGRAAPADPPKDRRAVLDARDQYYRESMVRWAEIGILRDKMKWCLRREGPNGRESCRELVMQWVLRIGSGHGGMGGSTA